MIIQVEVASFGVDHTTAEPLVILKACESDRSISIPVAPAEAAPIAIKSMNVKSRLPLTIDLVGLVLAQLGGKLAKVVFVNGDECVIARIHIAAAAAVHITECRASDALALAMRRNCPLFAEDALFDSEPIKKNREQKNTLRDTIRRIDTLEFGRYYLE